MSFAVIPSEEIAYRHDFPLLCNARGYLDAVEVGVDLGLFAREFLSRFEGNWLLLVDDYAPHPEHPHDRLGDMIVAAQALAQFHGRFRFLRADSVAAAGMVGRFIRPPGFVYLDGSHDEASVEADLLAWWPVLAAGGAIGGHDFDDDHPEVCAAVERFARARGLVVRLTAERDSPPSWYIYRNEPETLHQRLFVSGEIPNPHHAGPPAGRNGQAGLPVLSEAR